MLFVDGCDGKNLISPGTGVQSAQLSRSSSKSPSPVESQGVCPLEDGIFTSVTISASL